MDFTSSEFLSSKSGDGWMEILYLPCALAAKNRQIENVENI